MAHNKKQTVPKAWAPESHKGMFRASPLPSKPFSISMPLVYAIKTFKINAKPKKAELKINGNSINKLTDMVCLFDIVSYNGEDYRLIAKDKQLMLEKLQTDSYLILNPLYNLYEDFTKPATRITSFQGYNELVSETQYPNIRSFNLYLKSPDKSLRPVAIEPGFDVTHIKGRDKFLTEKIVGVTSDSILLKSKNESLRSLKLTRIGRDYVVSP